MFLSPDIYIIVIHRFMPFRSFLIYLHTQLPILKTRRLDFLKLIIHLTREKPLLQAFFYAVLPLLAI